MEKLKFELRKQSNLAFHRFQQLALDAFKEFDVSFRWQGAVWGKISRLKKRGLTNEQIASFLEKAMNDTRELAKGSRAAYFIFLINKKQRNNNG